MLLPLTADPKAPLARANPAAKLGAALLLMAALFWSLDAVTAAVVLGALLVGIWLSGLRPLILLARTWPILLLAVVVGALSAAFVGAQQGPLAVSGSPLWAGTGLALRLLGIALAGLLATATTQPIDLTDSLIAQLHVPPRLAVGVMAAVRLVPVLAVEWGTIGLARRARGMDAGRSPLGWVRAFGGRVFALLVAAVRRGTRLSVAMEGRGFGARDCRTFARQPRMRRADWTLLAAAALVAAGAVGVSAAVGTWQPLLG